MRKLLRLLVAVSVSAAATQAQANWYEAKSNHFVIWADESPNQLKLYAQNLERFDSAARQLMGLSDPPLTDAGRVNIFVLPSLGAVSKLAGASWVGGLYVSRADGSFAFVPDLNILSSDYSRVIFFHEYTHHLQLQNADYPVPEWVAEGFADFMSTAEVNSDGSMTFGKQAPGREWSPMQQSMLPLNQLVGESYGKLNDRMIDYLYARGWLLTNYLLGEPKRRNEISTYVNAIAKGAKPIDAAQSAFGDLNKLERDLENYANSNSLHGFKVGADIIRIGPVALRPLTPGEVAIMDVRVHSKRSVDENTAPIVAAEAAKVAQQFPNDAFVQSCVAEAEFDAKDYAAAEAAADKALAANPNDIHALIYKGRIEMALAAAKPGKAADWDGIRDWFLKANKLDTENAEPLELYYESYGAAHQPPTPNAVDALVYAMTLAPQDEQVRMNATMALLAEGKAADARKAFALIGYQPHLAPQTREWADKVMQAIDSGDTKGALTLIASFKPAPEADKKK